MPAYTLVIALTALLLAGCGQKGPLHLPAEAEQVPTAEQPAPPLEQGRQKTKQSS